MNLFLLLLLLLLLKINEFVFSFTILKYLNLFRKMTNIINYFNCLSSYLQTLLIFLIQYSLYP